MRISELTIRNYRCINEIKIDKLSPVTVLVGRNNTGKSAVLEAFALGASAKASWYDAIGGDLIDVIINLRGDYDYADLIVKLDSNEAEIRLEGENLSGTVKITNEIGTLERITRSSITEALDHYITEAIDTSSTRADRMMDFERRRGKTTRAFESRERARKISLARREAIRQIKACFSFKSKSESGIQTATVYGAPSEPSFDSDLYEILPYDNIIRTAPQGISKTLFSFALDFDFIAELQRNLARSGQLISLIRDLRKKIPYFKDIREVDEDFLVFIEKLRKPIPLQSMGDGFSACLALLASISMARGGILLIEEPESNLHPGFMSMVVDRIVDTAENGEVQYAISTHNMDFLEFLLDASTEAVSIIRMYRLPKTADIDYEILSGSEAKEELKSLKMDLRGP